MNMPGREFQPARKCHQPDFRENGHSGKIPQGELSAGDAGQKQLCAIILNEHSGWTGRTRVLIRAVGTEIRGVLSDSYRRLNSVDILTAFIRGSGKQRSRRVRRLYE